MGRPKVPITTEGPVAVLAAELRQARAAAGNPTYRAMASRANWSHNGLATADRGDRVPTWQCIQAYLRALDITEPRDLVMWRHKWRTAATQAANRRAVDKMRLPRQRIPDTTADTVDAGGRPGDGSAGPLRAPEITAESTTNDLRHKLIEVAAERGITREDLVRRVDDPTARVVDGFRTSSAELRKVLDGDEPLTVTVALNIVALCGGEQADIQSWYRAWSKVYPVERRAQEQLDQLKRILQHQTGGCTHNDHQADRADVQTCDVRVRDLQIDAARTGAGQDQVDSDAVVDRDDNAGQHDDHDHDHVHEHGHDDRNVPDGQQDLKPPVTTSPVAPPVAEPLPAPSGRANTAISELMPCVPRHQAPNQFLRDALIRRSALILGLIGFGALVAGLLTVNLPTAVAAGGVVVTAGVCGWTAGAGVNTSSTITLIKAVQRHHRSGLPNPPCTAPKRTSECLSSC